MSADRLPALRALLAESPRSARQLAELLGVSQPGVSRAILGLGREVLRFGPYRSIQYALRRPLLALEDIPVYRVSPEGRVQLLGTLSPVQPTGYVMSENDGRATLYEGMPWWLDDMRPQGFLGRAFVAAQAGPLGLPARLGDWQEEHVLRALLSQPGSDGVGNLLLGDAGREYFIQHPDPVPLPGEGITARYAELARLAMRGEVPASSAGGEQPKFASFVETPAGPRHVLVKFSLSPVEAQENPLLRRWRDLLLAEHRALSLLREGGIGAVASRVLDQGGQRFLEVERFDRVGLHGRRGVVSLSALDAEFVGLGQGGWPAMTARLAAEGHITKQAHETACLLHAFGSLIGNTDMHPGNLSFVTDSGRPWELAPAYDMLPMAFAPRASGALPDSLPAPSLAGPMSAVQWRQALSLAREYVARLGREEGLDPSFAPCLAAIETHLDVAEGRIRRLG